MWKMAVDRLEGPKRLSSGGETQIMQVCSLKKGWQHNIASFFLSCQNEYHETYSAVKNSELLRRGNKFIMYLSLPQALC